MNRKLLSLLAGATLTFSLAVHADHKRVDTHHKHTSTVMEKLVELKENLKDTAKAGMEKFSEKTADVYHSLSTQIDEMFHSSKDKNDAKILGLKHERDDIKKELDTYNQTEDAKTEEMRRNLVRRLEELNEKISDYNKSLKK